MKWNPYLNALCAALYIWGVASLIHYISSLRHDTPDNLVGSIAAISLVVCSAAVMAFLFFYQPITLLIENKKEEAIFFFLKTLGAFGVLTILALVAVIS